MNKVVKMIFVVIVFLSDYSLVFSQAVTWQKWYDYNNLEDNGQDVIQTFDGGYIILSNSYTPLNPKSAVFKTDKFGNVEWQKLYDMNNIGGNFLTCFTITQVKDSGYVISGGNRDSAIIFKINKLGDINWIKRYSKLGRFSGRFLDHKITHDGGIIACGYLYDPSIGYVVRTDSIGSIQWDSVYDFNSDVVRIIESKDGSFYMLGIGTTLFKTNEIGNVIWKKNFFLPNKVDLIEHPSGYIFIGGGLDSILLYKIDTSSSIIFEKNYYIGVSGCASMCVSKDGNILLAAILNTRMAVSKVDLNGNLIFSKPIPTIDNTSFAFLPYAVYPTNDSGFIFTGFTNYPPTFHESNIFATKTDFVCNAPLMLGINSNNILIPESFILYQNFPNPFNPVTTIFYELRSSDYVELVVYDIMGREVTTLVNEKQSPGTYQVEFDGSNLTSGVYFYRLNSGEFMDTKRMLLVN